MVMQQLLTIAAFWTVNMFIYAVDICTFSSDMYGESYIDSYWSTKEKAENHILEKGLLDKGYESVTVFKIQIDKE